MIRRTHIHEGRVAKAIERRTVKIPSDLFLWAAGGSVLAALVLRGLKRHQDAGFVGQWVAPFLMLGMYNKMVKLLGSE